MKIDFRFVANWIIIASLIVLGSAASWFLGVFQMTNTADVTKISFLIYLLFLVFSGKVGHTTYKLFSRGEPTQTELDQFDRKEEISWFMSDVLLTLGMLGTILGYIYMIQVGFAKLDPKNLQSLHGALKSMALGWGTALYTTAAGLICSLGLKLQLFNLTRMMETVSEGSGPREENPTSTLPLQGLEI